jgi:4-amino-4-deoxy-L-arabinose transferase-like glycosyltransferase
VRHTESLPKSWLILTLAILYLTFLGRTGFLGPDEPRYASMGREMARSGDWVTPRLDGSPWFEKPPLLYWMTGAAMRLRLHDEWAARLPVALASLAFLIFFYGAVEREFSARVAALATAILATSAGWLAYSFTALPDLPMSAALDAAVFIALFDTRPGQGIGKPAYVAGALLGLAILAKGFVPVVLFAPILLIARRKRWRIAVACVAVAGPWYILCTLRNGHVFWNDFFWKHHVGRFLNSDLQHVQPFWYYLPIVLAGLFPWTPTVLLAAHPKTWRKIWDDERVLVLALWFLLGLVFFSLSKNKLPGYMLPLMPALAVILAVAVDRAPALASAVVVAVSVLLLILLPLVAAILPGALMTGVRSAYFSVSLRAAPVLLAALVAAVSAFFIWSGRTHAAVIAAVLGIAGGVTWFKLATFPLLDQRVSVRAFWRANSGAASSACLDPAVRRMWAYGLNYYAPRPLPECAPQPSWPYRVGEHNGKLIVTASDIR